MSFDPQVWGTVAEWVAGIATVLVAAVLGGIAIWQARQANKWARRATELQVAALRNDFTAEMNGPLITIGLAPGSASVWIHKVTVWTASSQKGVETSKELHFAWRGTILMDDTIPEHLQAGETTICAVSSVLQDKMADLLSLTLAVHWSATPDAEIFDTKVPVDLKLPSPHQVSGNLTQI